MSERRELVSVVVPVFREELNIRPFYDALLEAVADADFDIELLFVDDGSPDETWQHVQKLASDDERVRALRFSRNFGSYAAIAAGLSGARGDAVVCISVDLQDPPSLITQFVKKWREGNDIVWAVRESRDDPFFKSLLAKTFYGLIRRGIFPDFPEGGMDVGLFSRRVVDLYNRIPERHSIPFFTIYNFGFRQARVPYHRRGRERGTSGWPFWRRVRAAQDVFISFSYAPIRIISTLGLFTGSLAFVYAAFVVLRKLIWDAGGAGWPSMIVIVLATSGVQMFLLGIVAEYLWRQGEYIRSRPRFILMEEMESGGAVRPLDDVADPCMPARNSQPTLLDQDS